jgi:hypothetical protein
VRGRSAVACSLERLALMAPSGPTVMDSAGCSRPTCSAPEPRVLILGSPSAPAGAHSWPRAVAWRMTALVRADGASHAPRTTGGRNPLIRRVLSDFPRSLPRYRRVSAEKTRRITRGGPATGSWQIRWAPAPYCGPRGHQCEPDARPSINDGGPARVLDGEPDALPLRAATVTGSADARAPSRGSGPSAGRCAPADSSGWPRSCPRAFRESPTR